MSLTKMPEKKADTAFWDGLRGKIHTRKGGWEVGQHIHNQGYSMMEDLVGKASFFQVLVLNVTGRLPEPRLAEWLEALFICLSWPDSRIWCNQIGSLAGTMRATPVAGVSAAILASDSRMYGPGSQAAGVAFIKGALGKWRHGVSVAAIVSKFPRINRDSPPKIPGYIRPVAIGDERVAAMKKVTNDLGFEIGDHLTLAIEIENEMTKQFNESMNLLGFAAAFLCDQDLGATDQSRLVSAMVHSGAHACYAEAADRPPESFFPLQCNDIDYQGPPARAVPSAE